MAKNLFVAGLSYDTTSDGLNKHFSEIGTVTSAQVIMDKYTNRSKGFGFVEMSTEEEAKKAINDHFKPIFLGEEEAALLEAYNRVLSQDVVSTLDIPPFNRSTVDGSQLKPKTHLEPMKTSLQH